MKWLYFEKDSRVYRWPDNGKKLVDQDPHDVHVYEPDGTWLGPRKALLYSETMSGWFSENTDRLTEAQALELMAKTTAKAQAEEKKES